MNDDTILDVLREVHSKRPGEVPFELVESCFRIEARNLFERNREVPISYLRKLVTLFVEKESEADAQSR
jgi:hypothetical protein